MRITSNWRTSLGGFFHERAGAVKGVPSIQDLCFISARDPRLWSDPQMRADLAASIISSSGIGPASKVLEVGCAAGFLAQLVAPHVGRYEGVDLVSASLRVARRLKLPNALFRRAAGETLPYRDNNFDAAFCYDVYTNFPKFEDGAILITEMLRVVRPGGRVLIGSIPDAATESAYLSVVPKVAEGLHHRYGPIPERSSSVQSAGIQKRLRAWFGLPQVRPEIICYYFRKQDFHELGRRVHAAVDICDIHSLSPYVGYRFDVIYRKAD
jgi:SAM-dependent methyltransferase